MRLVHIVKSALSRTKSEATNEPVGPTTVGSASSAASTPTGPPPPSSGVHGLPPGHWPREGPRPSRIAVLTYYLSIIATMIGVCIVIRSYTLPYNGLGHL